MSKHIGNDYSSLTHFRIISIDSAANSVLVEYDQNAWLRGQEEHQLMSLIEFVQGLKDGRFEIHRIS